MIRYTDRHGSDDGFTLVELIVVIGLMSILMALAVPSFVGLQQMVQNAATRADLGSDRTALIGWGIDNNGAVPARSGFDPSSSGLNLVGYGWANSGQSGPPNYQTNPAGSAWCLDLVSGSGTTFRVSQNSAIAQGSCTSLGSGSY